MVRLTPRADRPVRPAEQRAFGVFVTALFSHRRKVLPRAMAMGMPDLEVDRAHAVVAAAGLGADVRVEQVEPKVLLDLWRAASARP